MSRPRCHGGAASAREQVLTPCEAARFRAKLGLMQVVARSRMGIVCAVEGLALLAACGLEVACGAGGRADAGALAGGGGSAGGGGGATLGGEATNEAGTSSGTGGSTLPAGACPALAPAKDGHGVSALAIARAYQLLGMAARCDGAFAVVGEGSEVALSAQAGATLTSTAIPMPAPSESARVKLWVASFDSAGVANWVSAFWSGQTDGSGVDARPALFADGSLLVGGVYAGTGTFAVGQASEKTLGGTASMSPQAYIARYDSRGELSWARGISEGQSTRNNRTVGVATGNDGTSYALLQIGDPTPAGVVLAPGELDLQLIGGDLALVALDTKGLFTRAVRITHASTSARIAIATLADGSLSFVAQASAGATIAPGTASEMPVTQSGDVLLRFSPELTFEAAVALTRGTFAPLDDGSVITGRNDGAVTRTTGDGKPDWSVQVSHPALTGVTHLTGLEDGSAWVWGELGAKPGKLTLSEQSSSPISLDTTADTQSFVARIGADGVPSWVVPVFGARNLFLTDMVGTRASLILGGYTMVAGTTTFGSDAASATASGPSVMLARLGP
ncbi:MAG TPA: hypothetical protein VNG33_20400 [Polyangiaceae bacterium]|nr:hypothetical protein [Polyangiaceae bacterium]